MNKTVRHFTVAFSLLCLASCVSTKNIPLKTADEVGLKGASVTTTQRKPPSFGAMTASKVAEGAVLGAIGGAIAGASMIKEGDDIVRSNSIQDPAVQIGRDLASLLAKTHGMKVSPVTAAANGNDSPKVIAAAAAGADYVLDVRTINWSFVYYPTNWARYRVIYSVRLQLIDVKSGRVLAEGFHSRIPEKTGTAPGYDEMLANDAAYIKAELQTATAESVAHFRTKVFRL